MENNDLKKVNGYYVNKKNVGNRIFRIRNDRNDTLEEFGKLFGAEKSNVLKWENGSSLPNKSRIEKIAKKGNLTVNELLYGSIEEFVDNNKMLLLYQNEPLRIFFDDIPDDKKIEDFIKEIKSKQYTIDDIDKIVNYSKNKLLEIENSYEKIPENKYISWGYSFLDDIDKLKVIDIISNTIIRYGLEKKPEYKDAVNIIFTRLQDEELKIIKKMKKEDNN